MKLPKRRLISGLRETLREAKLKRLKAVIVAYNIEPIKSQGGLDDMLMQILQLANDQVCLSLLVVPRAAPMH
jgi:ribosomal protein L30E